MEENLREKGELMHKVDIDDKVRECPIHIISLSYKISQKYFVSRNFPLMKD